MTKKEITKLIMLMSATYPNYKVNDLDTTISAWSLMLEDISYKDAEIAFVSYVRSDTSGFAPSPGQLIDKITAPQRFAQLTETEAWALVRGAMNGSIYHYQERFAGLPETVRKAVGSADNLRAWAITDIDDVETVIQSNFMRAYRVECSRETELSKMPAEIKGMISKTLAAKESRIRIGKPAEEGFEELPESVSDDFDRDVALAELRDTLEQQLLNSN